MEWDNISKGTSDFNALYWKIQSISGQSKIIDRSRSIENVQINVIKIGYLKAKSSNTGFKSSDFGRTVHSQITERIRVENWWRRGVYRGKGVKFDLRLDSLVCAPVIGWKTPGEFPISGYKRMKLFFYCN